MREILNYRTPNLVCRIYPDLFPYGEGHPNVSRKVKVSFQQCCSHYLQLASRDFSNHPLFTLVAFDMISRARALNAISVTCKINPSEHLRLASVTSQELAEKRKKNVIEHFLYGKGIVMTLIDQMIAQEMQMSISYSEKSNPHREVITAHTKREQSTSVRPRSWLLDVTERLFL